MTAQVDKAVTAFLSKIGSKGGKASSSRMTKEERQERGRKGAKVRWAKVKKKVDIRTKKE